MKRFIIFLIVLLLSYTSLEITVFIMESFLSTMSLGTAFHDLFTHIEGVQIASLFDTVPIITMMVSCVIALFIASVWPAQRHQSNHINV
ncbi:hypothetical protein [Scopulibacillus cellulosilyticus]|uniref:Uncharacterized protein n=1 Tax=Scopulibacillus cellulosilyticus TaxID=2665665 RepID=A0ABW2Q0G6_9BACL